LLRNVCQNELLTLLILVYEILSHDSGSPENYRLIDLSFLCVLCVSVVKHISLDRTSLFWVYAKLVFTALFWGGTFIAGKIIVGHVGPFSAAFLRFVIASIFLLILVWKMEGRIPLPPRRLFLPIFLLGMTGVFSYNFCFLSGLKYIEAGRASVIVANNPIFIALLSAYFFKEKLTLVKLSGILLSVSGAIVVITKGQVLTLFQSGLGRGEFFILGTVASWVTYSLIGKALMTDLSPILSVTYSVLVGMLALFFPACFEGLFKNISSYSAQEWTSIFYLGFFGTVLAFIWYYQGIQRIGPTKAGLFINFVPISAVLLSALFLGEELTASLLVGLLLVSCGVYLTNRTVRA
jgi:drug/metabolite transporter (DMT)-like permease